jgi:hypothetical protein
VAIADQHHPARIDAMNLKNFLRQIDPNGRNLAHGCLPQLAFIDDTILALEMPSGGHPPHHLNGKGQVILRNRLRRVEVYTRIKKNLMLPGIMAASNQQFPVLRRPSGWPL